MIPRPDASPELWPASAAVGGPVAVVGDLIDYPSETAALIEETDRYLTAIDTDYNREMMTGAKRLFNAPGGKALFSDWKTFYGDWLAFLRHIQDKQGGKVTWLTASELKERTLAYKREGERYQKALIEMAGKDASPVPKPPDPPPGPATQVANSVGGALVTAGLFIGGALLLSSLLRR